jgi:hypothetical protein
MHVSRKLRVASFICFMFIASAHDQLKAQTAPAIINWLGGNQRLIRYYPRRSIRQAANLEDILNAGGVERVGIQKGGEVGFSINNFGHVSLVNASQEDEGTLAHCSTTGVSVLMAWSGNSQSCRNTTLSFVPGEKVEFSNIFENQYFSLLASVLVNPQTKSAVPNSDRLYFCSAISETGGWGAAATTTPWDVLSSDDPCKVAVSRCEENSNGANCTIENAGIKVIDSSNKVYTPAYSCDGKGFLELQQEEKFVPWQDLDTSLRLKSKENHRSCVVSILDRFEYALSPTSDQETVVYVGYNFNSLPGFNFENQGPLVMILAGSVSITSPLYERPVTLTNSQMCGISGGFDITPDITPSGIIANEIIACNSVERLTEIGESTPAELSPNNLQPNSLIQVTQPQVNQVKGTQIYQGFFDQDAWGQGAQEPILGFEQAVNEQFIGFPVTVTPILE